MNRVQIGAIKVVPVFKNNPSKPGCFKGVDKFLIGTTSSYFPFVPITSIVRVLIVPGAFKIRETAPKSN